MKRDWYPIIDRIERKLEGWKARYLSMGGRITLINSVLSSTPLYLMSIFLFTS